MKNTFFKLTKEKQDNLFNACIDEFFQNHYNSASINRIIQKAKISKGGLFKYIKNKKDLYLYTIERVLCEVIKFQSNNVNYDNQCYFSRLEDLISAGFYYYKQYKKRFKVALNAFTDFSSPCYEDVVIIRRELIKKYQSNMLKNIYWEQYKINKDEALRISAYLLNGYNITLIQNMKNIKNVEDFEKQTLKDIDLLFKVIKQGAIGGARNDQI